jgi:cyclopropane fatty-acyl-phospholipid synthase-like methyltransferase
MSEYWKSFWDNHTDEFSSQDPFQQVSRTINKKSPSKEEFDKVVQHYKSLLYLKSSHEVLDFCCGNGLFSREIALDCKQVTSIDFCQNLISELKKLNKKNIIGIQGDAMEINFEPESFDRIVFFAALQYFTENEAVFLFNKFYQWLKPDGILFISDILDRENIWEFYDNQERKNIYFMNLENRTPILGNWYDRKWVEELGAFSGFINPRTLSQPSDFWFSHYRFDFICKKQ